MNTNKVADAILTKLLVIHPRVFRNAPSSTPTFPYIVFDCETVTDTTPSDDYYIYINIYDAPKTSVRAINDLADSIEGLDETLINDSVFNLYLTRISRQFISNNELTTSQAINLQMSARVYFK